MKFVHDESYHLDQYIINLYEKIQVGQLEKKRILTLIDILVKELEETKKPYMESVPPGLRTLNSYLVMGIDLYISSLNNMKGYLSVPRKEIFKESIDLAENASLILNNVGMVIAETKEMIKALTQMGEMQKTTDVTEEMSGEPEKNQNHNKKE